MYASSSTPRSTTSKYTEQNKPDYGVKLRDFIITDSKASIAIETTTGIARAAFDFFK